MKGKVQGEGQFLLASHNEEGYRVYGARFVEGPMDLTLSQGVEVAIDDRWMSNPQFARDVQAGRVVVRRSDDVPESTLPDVSETFGLDGIQAELARRIVRAPKLTEELRAVVRIHELLGPGGMTPNGVRVTKKYVQDDHARFLRAALDLEQRSRKRPPILRLLRSTLKEIEAL